VNKMLTEGTLHLSFSGVKTVRRWDGSSAYTQGIRRLSTTAAADFCAVLEHNDAPVLLEVTDYRGYRRIRPTVTICWGAGCLW